MQLYSNIFDRTRMHALNCKSFVQIHKRISKKQFRKLDIALFELQIELELNKIALVRQQGVPQYISYVASIAANLSFIQLSLGGNYCKYINRMVSFFFFFYFIYSQFSSSSSSLFLFDFSVTQCGSNSHVVYILSISHVLTFDLCFLMVFRLLNKTCYTHIHTQTCAIIVSHTHIHIHIYTLKKLS